MVDINYLEKYDVFGRMDELNEWKDSYATPNIENDSSNILTIINDISNNIIPQINDSIAKINEMKNDINTVIIPSINDVINRSARVEELVNLIVPKINAARQVLDKALLDAKTALQQTNIFKTRLTNAGSALKTANSDFIKKTNALIETTKTELVNIENSFINLGIALKNGGKLIYDQSANIGNSLVSSYNDISVPVNRANYYIQILKKPNIVDLMLTFFNVYKVFSHLSFENYGGKSGAFQEVMNMFNRIANEFTTLGNNFKSFGSSVYDKAQGIPVAMEAAINNISTALVNYLNSFGSNLYDWALELLEPTDKEAMLKREADAAAIATTYAKAQADSEAKIAGQYALAFCLAFVGAFAQAYCVAFSIAFCIAFGKALGMSEDAARVACESKKDQFAANCVANRAAEKAIEKAKAEGQCQDSYNKAYDAKYAEVYPKYYRAKYSELILGAAY
jgi:hypothetical protein